MMMGDVRAVTPGSRFEGGKTRKTPPQTCATRNLANESSKLRVVNQAAKFEIFASAHAIGRSDSGNHFIKIHDKRIPESQGSYYQNLKGSKGSIDISFGNIHDRKKVYGNSDEYLKSLSEDDTNMKDFVWLSGEINLGKEVERRPFTAVEVIHLVPVLTETNDLGGKIRQAKAETEEKEKQERLKREELEKQRKYEEGLRNRTERGEKFEFTPEQLHEIVNNTPEGQRLLQEKKRRLEEEAGGAPREDSRVASLAEKVDEDLVVAEASSVGGEENT